MLYVLIEGGRFCLAGEFASPREAWDGLVPLRSLSAYDYPGTDRCRILTEEQWQSICRTHPGDQDTAHDAVDMRARARDALEAGWGPATA